MEYYIKKEDEYKDEKRPLKDYLTDHVTNHYLQYNEQEVNLIRLIYEKIQPMLDKYNLKLVFKGGNVLRMIASNLSDYIPGNAKDIMMSKFAPFLKQSDNDFSIFIPNSKNFDNNWREQMMRVFLKVREIRDEINKNTKKYLYDYKTNPEGAKKFPIYDQIIEEFDKDTILITEYTKSKKSPIYCNINDSLEFGDIKFGLVRSKISFMFNNGDKAAGELIDISFPHKDDQNFPKNYEKFMRNNIDKVEGPGFDYYIINISYIIHDLEGILFNERNPPWADRKYEKRLARLILFIFLEVLEEDRPKVEVCDVLRSQAYKTVQNLKMKLEDNKKLNHNSERIFGVLERDYELSEISEEYYTECIKYLLCIIEICKELKKYLSGRQNIDPYKEMDIGKP